MGWRVQRQTSNREEVLRVLGACEVGSRKEVWRGAAERDDDSWEAIGMDGWRAAESNRPPAGNATNHCDGGREAEGLSSSLHRTNEAICATREERAVWCGEIAFIQGRHF